jgi:hypothetical protein
VFGVRDDVRGGVCACGFAVPNEKFIGVGNAGGRDGAGATDGGGGRGADGGGRGTTMASGGIGFGNGVSAVAGGDGGSGGVGSGSGAGALGGAGGGGAAATGGGDAGAGGVGAGAGGVAGGSDGVATKGFGLGRAGPFGEPPSNTIATVDGGGSSSSCRPYRTVMTSNASSVRCSHSDMTSTGPSRRGRRREASHGRRISAAGMAMAWSKSSFRFTCHCEGRSDEAIPIGLRLVAAPTATTNSWHATPPCAPAKPRPADKVFRKVSRRR